MRYMDFRDHAVPCAPDRARPISHRAADVQVSPSRAPIGGSRHRTGRHAG